MREYNVGVYGKVLAADAGSALAETENALAEAGGRPRPASEEELELFMVAFEEEGRGAFTSEPAFVGGADLGVRVTLVAEGPLAAAGVVEGIFGRAGWRSLSKGVTVEVTEIEAVTQEGYEERLERETRGIEARTSLDASLDAGLEEHVGKAVVEDAVGDDVGERSLGGILRGLLGREPLVGMSEAADVLGMVRQQVDRLEANRKAGRGDGRFPVPVAWPAGRPAWLLSEIEAYGRGRGRGRMVTLGGLRDSREKRGISQERVAADAGVALSTIQRAEAGSAVRVATAVRLAKGLGLRLAELGPTEPSYDG